MNQTMNETMNGTMTDTTTTDPARQTLRIADRDNVAVALRALAAGTAVQGSESGGVILVTDVPAGHKIALLPIRAGAMVRKYGFPIGIATRDIAAGEHVHTHNLASTLRGDLDPARRVPHVRTSTSASASASAVRAAATFDGFRRADGRVGIRNEIWIVNTVGCVNNAAERIAAAARAELGAGSGVDGVYAFPHPFGCSQLGSDLESTQRILAGLARHPNAAGVLVLGLGCENNQMRLMLDAIGPGAVAAGRVQHFNAQEVGDEVQEGLSRVRALAAVAARTRREPVSSSELVLGMKCGGSDGLSGITANPLVGRIADRVSEAGGTVLLSEVPEMFGAEDVLLDRATGDDVARQTVDMVNDFRAYFRRHNQPIDENPAPGNRDGGITTLAEKSLGCVQKGGDAPVVRVLGYGEAAPTGLGGIGLVNAPGNDGVSSTAMVAAGAQMLLFTTGRGTPLGFPAPTIKISTSSDLARRKASWIDFDAGPIADGTGTFAELGDRLFALVLDVASGRVQTKNEQNGFREISIWKDGVTL
jgi:altronate hydrolase